jgi:class 3 adenylate cyclase
MSMEAQGTNRWRDLLLPVGPQEIPRQRFRTTAVLRLALAVPLAIGPTNAYLYASIAQAWEPVMGRVAWLSHFTFMAVYVVINLALYWMTRAESRTPPGRLRGFNATAAVCELGTTQAFMLGFGCLLSYAHCYIILIVAGYCALFDYRTAVTTSVLGSLVFVLFAVLEVTGQLPLAPLMPTAPTDVFWSLPENAIGPLLGVPLVALFTFILVNFAVNQRLRLHQYITRSVLQRYLPPALVDRAADGELQLDAPPERRVMTVMFTDICGFTRLSEELGPEKVGELLNTVLGEVADLAHRHGATVDKFIGDCAMVVFGAPEPLPPDEQVRRALALAADIHACIPELGAAHALQARTGINTGESVVGNFGSIHRSDYTVIGPAVNVAARLEGKSRPGAILVGADSVGHLADRTGLVSAGALELKGVSAPVEGFFYTPPARIQDV